MILYSTIIPTYNRCSYIANTLDSLLRQTISPNLYEIIIVDDGSEDDTETVIRNYIKTYPLWNIEYIRINHGGPAKAKNTGINSAKGKILFFTDDDCIVPANWIKEIVEVFTQNRELVGVGGWHRPPNNKLRKNVFIQFHYLLHRFYYGYNLDYFSGSIKDFYKSSGYTIGNEKFYPIITANVAFKKSALKKVHGFNESFLHPAYEDLELNNRIISFGYNMNFISSQVIDNRELTFKKLLYTCITRTKAQYAYIKITKNSSHVMANPFNLIYQFYLFLRLPQKEVVRTFSPGYIHILLASVWFLLSYFVYIFLFLNSLFSNFSAFSRSEGVSISKANSLSKG